MSDDDWTVTDRNESGWRSFLGRVWHMTWPDPARQIIESGQIIGSSGDRPFSMPQTSNSYALRHGYVALFDFRDAELRLVEDEAMKWSQYFWGEPYRVGFSVDVTRLGTDLIPWHVAKSDPNPSMWIPYFEAWSSKPVPLSAISAVCITVAGIVVSRTLSSPSEWRALGMQLDGIGLSILRMIEEAEIQARANGD